MKKTVDYELLSEFRHQIRTFLHFSEEAAKTAGIEPQQHQLLLALKGLPSDLAPTISNLAGRLHVRHHTVVELADRLSDRGLLKRQTGTEDRRVVHLLITPRGESLLQKLTLIHYDELQSAAPLLLKTLKKLIHENERKKDRA